MSSSSFEYVTYIRTTPEKLWESLIKSAFTEQYWFGRKIKSDWNVGSPVTFSTEDGTITDKGEVLIYEPYRILSYTFLWVEDYTLRENMPVVTFTLHPMDRTVKLTLKHEKLHPTDFYETSQGFQGINNGWPAILSNLKTLLETGELLPAIKI